MKIFCIGFNKTGTTSLNKYFNDNKINSTHNSKWWYYNKNNLYSYTAFTDGYEHYDVKAVFPNLEMLSEFEDSKFILNTRELDKWMISRLNHGSEFYLTGFKQKEFNDKVFLRWIIERNYWHKKVINYFKNKNKFIIINVEKDKNIKQKLDKFLNLKSKIPFPHENKKTIKSEKDIENIEKINNFLIKNVYLKDHKSIKTAKLKVSEELIFDED